MTSQTIERLEVLISKPGERYELLNEAEAMLQQAAMAQKSAGIRVTRHDPARYTLELSDTVPFGETWEEPAGRNQNLKYTPASPASNHGLPQ